MGIPWVQIVFFLGLLALSFSDVLTGMANEWWTDDDMSHGMLVPVAAAYIAWQIRDQWLPLTPKPNPLGLAVVAWGGLQLMAGTLGAEMFIARTGFVIAVAGVILYLGGTQALRALAFPLFLLVFMIRIPAIIYNQVTFPLQLFATTVAEQVLNFIGIPVFREGNILELANDRRLSVVEACSGIRSLLSLSFLALVYAYMFDAKVWMRYALLLLTVPIAVGVNAFRVTMTGVINNYRPELAEGFMHTAEGFLTFGVAGLCLWGAHHAVNAIHGRLKPAA